MIRLALALVCLGPGPQGPAEPEWIWGRSEARESETCWFRRAFELQEEVRGARLVLTCDNEFTAFVNGAEVCSGDDLQRVFTCRIEGELRRGRNVLAVRARNDGGPAALIARLELRLASGERTLVSDARFRASFEEQPGWTGVDHDDSGWRPAHSFGAGAAPWGDPLAPGRATPAESLVLPDGFAAELLRSAQAGEGSWVCLTFDSRGRLIVSPQRGGLLRFTLLEGGAVEVEPLDAPVGDAQGLSCVGDSLYVNVNAAADRDGGLWRLRDVDGDGRYERSERLSSYGPGGEHGPHAVVPGPERDLWLVNGNMTSLPELSDASPHRHYAEDQLLPREWDPRGHAVGVRAPGSQVFRVDPDGRDWRLWASGMRNAYDLAFNPEGELFSFDSDMEWDIGLPWYRPTRIVHVVSGGEYGWRAGSGKWPTWYPDSLPAVVDVGVSSPTGMAFGTGSRFPEPYRSALFVGDWAYGRILAVHLRPFGATYTGSFEEFVVGAPLNVTDFEFGPDGALYFVTGGRGTQSGLYRVRHLGGGGDAARPADAPEAVTARALRRWLESLHRRGAAFAIEAAWPHLASADRFVRHAARVAIEHQDPAEWRERALAERDPGAALEALLALARVGAPPMQERLLERLGELGPSGLEPDRLLGWLRVHDLCCARMGRPGPEVARRVRARLDPLYPADAYPLNRELSRLLVYLEAPGVVERTLRLLRGSRRTEQQFHFAFVLRNAADGWTPELREDYFAWIRSARDLEGGHSLAGYLDVVQRDALRAMPGEEQVRWTARLADESRPAERPAEPEAPGGRAWQLADLAGDLDEVGRGRSFASGKAAFERALCSACHRFASAGGALGPDLTAAGRRFARRDLLEAILRPSKDISDQYQSVVVTRKNGAQVTGRIVEQDEDRIALLLGAYGDDRTEVARSDVRSVEASQVSTMPAGLLDALTRDQVLDLLAYIESAGDPGHPAFVKK